MIIGYALLHTLGVLLLNALSITDKVNANAMSEQDSALLEYCMMRVLVICPRCRVAFRVTGLDEQMNVEWRCSCCGCEFREYATHTKEKT